MLSLVEVTILISYPSNLLKNKLVVDDIFLMSEGLQNQQPNHTGPLTSKIYQLRQITPYFHVSQTPLT